MLDSAAAAAGGLLVRPSIPETLLMRLLTMPVLLLVLTAGAVRAQDAAPPSPADTLAVDWSTTVDTMEPDPPASFVAVCPPEGSADARIYGTGTYTNDSSICLAAVHAGALTREQGGTVIVEVVPGLTEYVGTTRYGLTSESYPDWHGSIRFPAAPADSVAAGARVVHQLPGNWDTRANQLDATVGAVAAFECSAGGRGGNVWGVDVYTDDSSICEAAVHAGRITREEGGIVHFELLGARQSFEGSERNGVTTMRYPGWPGSFAFVELEEPEPAE